MRLSFRLLAFAVVCATAARVVACSSSATDDPQQQPAEASIPPEANGGAEGGLAEEGGPVPPVPPLPPVPPPPSITITRETATVGGMTRSYALGTPTTYDAARKYPVVFAFHGNPGDANQMLGTFPASGQDAILVFPEALGFNWDLSTPPGQNADVTFIKALPAIIEGQRNVDVARVFGWGYSGGGFFLNQYVCRVGGTFKAFASMAGGAPYEQQGDQKLPNGCIQCTGDATPALLMHGLDDLEVPPGGSTYGATCWATKHACAQTNHESWPAIAPAPCKKADGCSVELCMVPGLNHGIWGQASQAAWTFFQAAP